MDERDDAARNADDQFYESQLQYDRFPFEEGADDVSEKPEGKIVPLYTGEYYSPE